MPTPAEVLVATPIPGSPSCALGESARWHDGAWWWVDATQGRLYRATHCMDTSADDPAQGWDVRLWFDLGGRLSLAEPAGPGRMLLARDRTLEFHALDPATRANEPRGAQNAAGTETAAGTEKVDVLAHLDLADGWMLNDGALDPARDAWIGVLSPRRDSSGWLAHIRGRGLVERAVSGIELSNGLVFTQDRSLLFHADSSARVVRVHRLEPASGRVLSSTDFIVFADDDGMPDGVCADGAGGIWVAVYGRGQARRYDAEGVLRQVVSVATPQATSVCLGGPDGGELIITTAREEFDEGARAADPLAGRTFHLSLRAPQETTE